MVLLQAVKNGAVKVYRVNPGAWKHSRFENRTAIQQ